MARGRLVGVLALGALGALALASSSGPSSSTAPPRGVDYLERPPGGVVYPPHGPAEKVAAYRTPFSPAEAESLLVGGWTVAVPGWGAPPPNIVAALVIQSALETDGWRACWNNNLGNVTAYDRDRPYFEKRSKEYKDGQPFWKVVPYRSYTAPGLGAWDMAALLATRYRAGLAAAARGDLDGYAAALKARGYYSGPESAYARLLRTWQSELGYELEGGRAVA